MADIRSAAKNGYAEARRGGYLEVIARLGFGAKGVVYFLIGILALMAAAGFGGETTSQEGVLRRIAAQPFGEFALAAVAAGLLAYATWRFLSAIMDAEHEGSDAKGYAKRTGQFVSGLAYTSVALTAIGLLAGNGGGGGGQSTQTWTARLLAAPGGTLIVMAIGVLVIGVGIYQMRKGLKEKFREKLQTHEMSATEEKWATRAGKWGYAARGVVFMIIGVFFIVAAWQHDPGDVRGLEGVLDTLAQQPFGQFLLGAVALGLALYGLYALTESKYRRVNP